MWQRLREKPALLALLLSLPFVIGLGAFRLFDWDEVNFAECSREMLLTGEWWIPQINFELFWEKPPFFFWMQGLFMQLFGIGEFASRFPNVIAGFFTLWLLLTAGTRWHSRSFGIFWAVLYAATLLPHLYFRSGIIDPVFNLFMFAGYYFLIRALTEDPGRKTNALIAGLLVAGAVLTKGPVGVLLVGLAFGAGVLLKRTNWKDILEIKGWFLLSFLSILSVWFAGYFMKGGWELFSDFITYQVELFSKPVAGHKQPFWYHFVVVLIGCFPLAIPALPMLVSRRWDSEGGLVFWMRILWWVVLIVFTIVTTKIIHYSSLAYLPLSYLGVLSIHSGTWKRVWRRSLPAVWFVLLSIWGILFLAFPIFARFRVYWLPSLKDRFGSAQWSLPVDWQGWEGFAALFFIAGWILAWRSWKKGQWLKGAFAGWAGTVLVLTSYAFLVLPKVEAHTQATPIGWYEKAHEEGWAIRPVGFKTYADLFYGKKQPPVEGAEQATRTLTVVKITNKKFQPEPGMELLEEKGGFRFYIQDHQD